MKYNVNLLFRPINSCHKLICELHNCKYLSYNMLIFILEIKQNDFRTEAKTAFVKIDL